MNIRNFFRHGRKIPAKMIRTNYRKNPFMKEVMTNPEAAKILNQPKEQKEFHSLLAKKAKDGSLTGAELQETFYKLRQGEGEHISSKESRKLAGAFFSKWQKRYKKPTEIKPVIAKPENTLSSEKNIVSENNSAQKSNKVLPDYFRYRAKALPATPEDQKTENEYTSFYDAMRSVRRNQRK